MMKQSQQNASSNSMQTVFIDGQCMNLFLLEISDGFLALTTGEIFLVSLKLTFSIQKSYTIFKKIIHLLRRDLFLMA